MCRETPPGHVFMESFAEINPRKVAEVVHDKNNNASATHFFTLCPISLETCRLSLFRPQPHLPSFIQIHLSVRELLVKTTFQIVTVISE